MLKSKLIWSAIIASVVLFSTSCSKENDDVVSPQSQNKNESSFVISKADSIVDLTNHLKSSAVQWGSYPIVNSTGNGAKYFSAGLYAVKITRSLYDASTLTFSLVVQNQTNLSNANVWAYKNDANNNQLYFSGVQTVVPGGSVSPIPNLSITGSQSIIYVFKVVSAGYYMFWYRTV